jgi:hypothetical protein
MEKSLSDEEIRKYIPNVIMYSDLPNLSARDLLSRLPLVILYETRPNVGHWTLLHRTSDGVEFFDPYGFKPDREFEMIRPEYHQPHYINKLLREISDMIPLFYNQFSLQSRTPGINTCGRWVIARQMFSQYSIERFKRAIDQVSKQNNMSPDQLIVHVVP